MLNGRLAPARLPVATACVESTKTPPRALPIAKAPRGAKGPKTTFGSIPPRESWYAAARGFRVSWFASSGTFTDAHTGREEAGPDDPSSDNTWLAPATPGAVFLWIVLRDDRGGVAWKGYRVDVTAP